MAFPVQESNTTYVQTSNTATHTLTYPTGIAAGDLLIYFFSSDGGTHTTTWPGSGWVNALDQAGDTDSHYFGWGYKKATGSETGNLPSITLSTAQRATGAVFRFSSTADPDVTPPENGTLQILAANTGPNSPGVTPTGGANDYGFLAALGIDSDSFATVFPSNMTVGPQVDVRHTQSTGAGCFFDFHTVNTTSFDPTAWALNSAEESIAFTIAIYPFVPPTGALLDQDSFRAYNDGTQAGAVAKSAINTIFDQPTDEIFQLRYLVQQTLAGATTDLTSVVKPQFRINGGSWADVGAIPTEPSPPLLGNTSVNIDVEPEFPRNATDITWNNDGTIAYVTGDTGGAQQPMETDQYVCSTPYDFTTKAASSGTFQWSNASSQWSSRMLWDAKGYKAVQWEMSTGPTTAEFLEYDAGATTVAISAITNANPGVLTTATHGLTNDDVVLIKNVGGMVEVNDTYYKVAVLSTTTFSLKDDDTDAAIDTTGFGTFTPVGGTIRKITPYDVTVLAANGVSKDITSDISFDFTFGAQMWRYNNDGTIIYAIDHATTGNTTVKEYTLTTAYDLSSMSTTLVQSIALPADKESRAYHDFDFANAGTRVTWVYEGVAGAEYAEYGLSVAYDLSTIAAANISVFVDTLATVDVDDGPRSITYAGDGSRIYTAFAVNANSTVELYIRQFTLDLGTSTAVQYADSTFLTDGGATTSRIGTGIGPFIAGEIGESGTQTVTWTNPSTSEETEFLYAFLVDGVQVTRTDAIEVRLVQSDNSLLDSYTSTAQMNISGPIEAGSPATLNFTGLVATVDAGAGVTETALSATAFNFTGHTGSFISSDALIVTSSAPDTLNFPGGILPSVLDAAQTSIGAVDAETDSYSITVSAGSNRMLVVFVAYEWDDADAMAPSTVAYNTSESLTLLSSASIIGEEGTFNTSLDTWYLLNPTATTANLDVTLTGTFSGNQIATSAIVVENVKQSAPSPAFETVSLVPDPTSIANNSSNYTTDSLILDALALAADIDPTAGASQTELFDISVSTSSLFRLAGSSTPAIATSGDPTGATGPMSWTFASAFRAVYVQIGLESVTVPTALLGSFNTGWSGTAVSATAFDFTGLQGSTTLGVESIVTAVSATAFDFTGLAGTVTLGGGVTETALSATAFDFTGLAGATGNYGAAPTAASATAFDFTGLVGSNSIGRIETALAPGTLNFTGLQATLTLGDNPIAIDISGNLEFSGNIEINIE